MTSQRRLRNVNASDYGIEVSKSKVVVVQNGICDFYELRLTECPNHPVRFFVKFHEKSSENIFFNLSI